MDVSGATSDRIREQALALFLDRGYATASLREIADRVGITKASLYYHYPSKQDLLVAVVRPLLTQWHDVVTAAEASPHTPEDVRRVLRRCVDTMLAHRAVANLFLRDTAGILPALAPLIGDIVETNSRLRDWLAGPAPTPVARIRAVAVMELLRAALTAGATLGDVPDALVRRTLLETAELVLTGP
ncbi:TetR/AcrR family transcriptional regulator [Asanoa sp. WMMD1127]|uniref:TetR/AcrR family transcriptional regulator n=1 Tax=Asanoa sp. WMMD1127 TaxID=3016107 RepID=UPI0024160D07|nr:TetR/AcrR family transcriptional regulator [Asanoa sp. WMMD1127]MDG4825711.1 TetR/AcrR family transcriptional regulator [Asanoa sp. WMMD1127]